MQRLALLVPTNKMELLKEPEGLLKYVAADDATGHDLKELFKEAGLEEIEETKNEAPGELIKNVAADNATGHDLYDCWGRCCILTKISLLVI